MNWFTACVVYVLIWWTVLFAVLPMGTDPVAEPDAATGWRGAPAQARIGRKLLVTTLVSLVLWGVVVGLILSDWLSFRHGILRMPEDYTTGSRQCPLIRQPASGSRIFLWPGPVFVWTRPEGQLDNHRQDEETSSSCRVTGVSSLNLALPPPVCGAAFLVAGPNPRVTTYIGSSAEILRKIMLQRSIVAAVSAAGCWPALPGLPLPSLPASG